MGSEGQTWASSIKLRFPAAPAYCQHSRHIGVQVSGGG